MLRFYLTVLTFAAIVLPARAEERQYPVKLYEQVPITKAVIMDGVTVVVTEYQTVVKTVLRKFDTTKAAIVICDMWDNHWCKSAAKRCDELAKKAAPLVDHARELGMTIVHCPSDTMEFYKDSKARKRTLELKKHEPPKEKEISKEPLPIDDSDGGCDDAQPAKPFKAWKRQHEAIKIDEDRDFVTDKGTELWNVLQEKKIDMVFVMGVHTNMCVLNRSFAIKQLRKWDVNCALVRDLTDAMYNPAMKPKVSHEEGTNLVIDYIERNFCPTVMSDLFKKK